jgi:hypothetical protein
MPPDNFGIRAGDGGMDEHYQSTLRRFWIKYLHSNKKNRELLAARLRPAFKKFIDGSICEQFDDNKIRQSLFTTILNSYLADLADTARLVFTGAINVRGRPITPVGIADPTFPITKDDRTILDSGDL